MMTCFTECLYVSLSLSLSLAMSLSVLASMSVSLKIKRAQACLPQSIRPPKKPKINNKNKISKQKQNMKTIPYYTDLHQSASQLNGPAIRAGKNLTTCGVEHGESSQLLRHS